MDMGSTSTSVSPDPHPLTTSGAKKFPWVGIIWFSVLLCIPYLRILSEMVGEWFSSEDMGHGIFVPVVCGYIVWTRRDEILSSADRFQPNWWGLLLVIWGFIQAVIGVVGADFFIARTAFIVAVIGSVMTIGGFPLIRKLAFPFFLLLFMIRIPQFIYSQITFPLQIFASQLATGALSILGIPVMREGNVLELASQKLSVVEACSGIRSLISLSFLSLVYGYFFESKRFMRILLLGASIPIAIICNGARITLTGILSQYKPEFCRRALSQL